MWLDWRGARYLSYKTIGYVSKGERVVKIAETSKWIKIRYGSSYGYINKAYLKRV